MSNRIADKAQTLLHKAAEDELVFNWPLAPDAVFGFHAQQAAEKLLKALLAQLGVEFELTHNLTKLAKAVELIDGPIPDLGIPLRKLTRFGVVYRYEFPPLSATPDRMIVTNAIRVLREHIAARITVLSTTT
ncbi:HEPN domain-containing protein [Acidicapsa ligni]|uniref:HEPN domain-containing protein n=1 Tax=Acidicapsa ligni TaxID=542300 RepID=UPI0021DF77B5|nr:HEPN domain-containing protein [Acidicapsa ligni]